MATAALILLFSVPSAVVAGAFCKELAEGHIDVLCSLPDVKVVHSAVAWCVSGCVWLAITALACLGFFWVILKHTSALIPTVTLTLCGLALGAQSRPTLDYIY